MLVAPVEKPEFFKGFRSWEEVQRPEEDRLSTFLRWSRENVSELLRLLDPGVVSGMLSIFRIPRRPGSLVEMLKQTKAERLPSRVPLPKLEYRPGVQPEYMWDSRRGISRLRWSKPKHVPHEWAHYLYAERDPKLLKFADDLWAMAPRSLQERFLVETSRVYGRLTDIERLAKAKEELLVHSLNEPWYRIGGHRQMPAMASDIIAEVEEYLHPEGYYSLSRLLEELKGSVL